MSRKIALIDNEIGYKTFVFNRNLALFFSLFALLIPLAIYFVNIGKIPIIGIIDFFLAILLIVLVTSLFILLARLIGLIAGIDSFYKRKRKILKNSEDN